MSLALRLPDTTAPTPSAGVPAAPITLGRRLRLVAAIFVVLAMPTAPVAAQPGDEIVVQARDALRVQDRLRLAAAKQAIDGSGHPLAMWVDYWELGNRLATAQQAELDAFYARWPGTYVEDRLRNDWLLELGKRRDWADFRAEYPRFRMNDDREVTCWSLLIRHVDGDDVRAAAIDAWMAQRDADDGCQLMAQTLFDAKVFKPDDVWLRVRQSAELGRSRAARAAASVIDETTARTVADIFDNPLRWLVRRPGGHTGATHEFDLIALMRLAAGDPDQAATMLSGSWSDRLPKSLTATAWAQTARQAAIKQLPQAADQARRAWQIWRTAARRGAAPPWSDEVLAWHVRAALRQGADDAGRWQLIAQAVDAMSPAERDDASWVYWRARATIAMAPAGAAGDADRDRATLALRAISAQYNFYGKLATEDLGQPVTLPAPPAPLTAGERAATRSRPGLARALQLIALGLRSEGVREWNYTLRGMNDRELLAAAQWACDSEVWDRCINTSERTRVEVDFAQRFPMPFRDQVVAQAADAGLDPAVMYGLIRQESRFVTDARSSAGASGLMQLMPATAKWTARKIGMPYTPSMTTDSAANLKLGAAYLKLVLDDFGGSLAMAAAAYNAGPNRPRRWREGASLEPAAWAETMPFSETRDYVKKVLSNSVYYAARLGERVPSLKTRLGGTIGPRSVTASAPEPDLP